MAKFNQERWASWAHVCYWHGITSAASLWPKQVLWPSPESRIEEIDPTFWWEGLKSLIAKGKHPGKGGDFRLLFFFKPISLGHEV